MKYFKYQVVDGSLGKIWQLFTELGRLSEEEIGLGNSIGKKSYGHSLEIINSALRGSLSTTEESLEFFSLEAYEKKCRENDLHAKWKSAQKELHIVDEYSDDDDERVGYGDISSKRLQSKNNDYENIENTEAFQRDLTSLYMLRKVYIKKGVDIVELLISSLEGIPDAVNILKGFTSKDDFLKTVIATLCEYDLQGSSLVDILKSDEEGRTGGLL